jgi:hypothetical protein
MSFIKVGQENSTPIESHYEHHGSDSPIGTLACVDAWIEDFREDITRNDIPTMIIHGDDAAFCLPMPRPATSKDDQRRQIRGDQWRFSRHDLDARGGDQRRTREVPGLGAAVFTAW